MLGGGMVAAAGGPAFYTGRDMKKSHAGMHINASDWEAFMRHATATLEGLTVPARERDEVFEAFRGDQAHATPGARCERIGHRGGAEAESVDARQKLGS